MNFYKKFLVYFMVVVFFFGVVSCENGFEDFNVDLFNFIEISVNFFFNNVIVLFRYE